MIELIISGMMTCNLIGQPIIEGGDRQCKYRCQDKSLVYVSTNPQYSCPRILHERVPKESLWKRKENDKPNRRSKRIPR